VYEVEGASYLKGACAANKRVVPPTAESIGPSMPHTPLSQAMSSVISSSADPMLRTDN
jgi:hypothetical protein